LTALLAIPQGTALVDRVVADHALLRALRQRLDQENALLRQVLKLVQKVSEVVLNLCLVLGESVAFLHKLKFVKSLDLAVVVAINELARSSQVFVCPLALARVFFTTAHLGSTLVDQGFLRQDLPFVGLLKQSVCVLVIGLLLATIVLEKLSTGRAPLAFSPGRPGSVVAFSTISVAVTPSTSAPALSISFFVLRVYTMGESIPATAAASSSPTPAVLLVAAVATASASASTTTCWLLSPRLVFEDWRLSGDELGDVRIHFQFGRVCHVRICNLSCTSLSIVVGSATGFSAQVASVCLSH